MGNSIFRFKKFSINQESIGMKITADACLFATLVDIDGVREVLDIGSGTGLLSLMIAQRSPSCHITALDIDPLAFGLTKENFEASPWNERLVARLEDFRQHRPKKKFDLIVSNPPFFRNQTPSQDTKRKLAFHQDSFSLPAFFNFCEENLLQNGSIYLLYPTDSIDEISKSATGYGFFINAIIQFKGKASKVSHCACLKLTRVNRKASIKAFTCRNDDNSYTDAYRKLLSPFQIIF